MGTGSCANRRWKFYFSICVILFMSILLQLPFSAISVFSPSFVWSAVNKSLEEDRLAIVDANNEKVKVKGCVRVVLYNTGSEKYIQGNHSGQGVFLINVTEADFATQDVVDQVKERIGLINEGICVPCIVLISLVNLSANQEERQYRFELGGEMDLSEVKKKESMFQNYNLGLSQQLLLLLQFKTPIQARHLILVRLVETNDELAKCHGKKYTRYPRRLVSIWEQVLFDHFREARVIQGAFESEDQDNQNKVLISGKESGVWIWMCEEIIRRLEIQEGCDRQKAEEKDKCYRKNANMTTAMVDMTNRAQCRMYRARS